MNIIELAKQAGMVYREFEDEFANSNKDGVCLSSMQAFAALIAAHEREECAIIVEQMNSLLSPEIAAAIRARRTT